jgi:glycosyltransferase involved in cell wall biosynthesis
MKFINKSNNTIYLGDIDLNIPYAEGQEQEISLDDVKKSKHFRTLLGMNKIEITEYGDSIFEKNLIITQNNSKVKKEIKIEYKQPSLTGDGVEVKIKGHFYEAGGYAKVNRNLALGLNKNGIRVNVEAVNKQSNTLNEYEVRRLSSINREVSNRSIIIDSMIPTFSSMSGGGSYRILYTTVEAGSVPQQFLDTISNYNEIWVVSDFCKEVLSKYNIKQPIYVVPDSIDVNFYRENCEPYNFNPSLNDFVFLSVFGWSYRKGYDVLLKAYLREFSSKDPVSLLIISRYPCDSRGTDTVKSEIKKYMDGSGKKDNAHVARCDSVIPEEQMPGLYKAADTFVLFSRGEGFGIPYCEASLCGLPVLATNISGQTMFLNKENSYLIDIDEIVPIQAGLMHVHYWDDQLFPKLISEEVIVSAGKTMRYVFENHEEAKKKNKILQSYIKDNYSIDKVSNMAASRLKEIWSKIK